MDEVLAAEVVVRNLAVDHYLVADREGSVATVVFFDGELVARTGDDLPVSVFTNSPYAEMLELWRTTARREPTTYDDSHAEALDQLFWFIDFWPGVQATPATAGSLLGYSESFVCEPPMTPRRGGRRVRAQ